MRRRIFCEILRRLEIDFLRRRIIFAKTWTGFLRSFAQVCSLFFRAGIIFRGNSGEFLQSFPQVLDRFLHGFITCAETDYFPARSDYFPRVLRQRQNCARKIRSESRAREFWNRKQSRARTIFWRTKNPAAKNQPRFPLSFSRPSRCSAMLKKVSSISIPMNLRPAAAAATPVVPTPMQLSSTMSPGSL